MQLEVAVLEKLAGVMVIEVTHAHAALEERAHRRRIGVERQVEHRKVVAALRVQAPYEIDVALHARKEGGGRPIFQAELLQGAQPIGVAVEDEVLRHQLRFIACSASCSAA